MLGNGHEFSKREDAITTVQFSEQRNKFFYLPVSVLLRAPSNSKLEPQEMKCGGWMANTDSQRLVRAGGSGKRSGEVQE